MWLKNELHRSYRLRDQLSRETYFTYSELTKLLHPIQLQNLQTRLLDNLYIFGKHTHNRLKHKLHNLISEQIHVESVNYNKNHVSNFTFFNGVLNLSETIFSEQELELLNKGLNYSTKYHSSSVKSLLAQTDSIMTTVSNKFNVSFDYNKLIRAFNKCKLQTVNGRERRSLTTLKEKLISNNLIVTKADKGNCSDTKETVVHAKNIRINQFKFHSAAKRPDHKISNQNQIHSEKHQPNFSRFLQHECQTFHSSKHHSPTVILSP